MKQTIYNKKTGDAVTIEAVDAKEYLATGGWSTEKNNPPKISKKKEMETSFATKTM